MKAFEWGVKTTYHQSIQLFQNEVLHGVEKALQVHLVRIWSPHVRCLDKGPQHLYTSSSCTLVCPTYLQLYMKAIFKRPRMEHPRRGESQVWLKGKWNATYTWGIVIQCLKHMSWTRRMRSLLWVTYLLGRWVFTLPRFISMVRFIYGAGWSPESTAAVDGGMENWATRRWERQGFPDSAHIPLSTLMPRGGALASS